MLSEIKMFEYVNVQYVNVQSYSCFECINLLFYVSGQNKNMQIDNIQFINCQEVNVKYCRFLFHILLIRSRKYDIVISTTRNC